MVKGLGCVAAAVIFIAALSLVGYGSYWFYNRPPDGTVAVNCKWNIPADNGWWADRETGQPTKRWKHCDYPTVTPAP